MLLSNLEKQQLKKRKEMPREGDTKWESFKDIAVVSYNCYTTRIYREGMNPYEAATTPLKKKQNNLHVIDGIEGTRAEHCTRLKLNYTTIASDMKRHDLTFEEAVAQRIKKNPA